MDTTKFTSLVDGIASAEAQASKFDTVACAKGFKRRLDALLDIKLSMVKFFQDNLKFFMGHCKWDRCIDRRIDLVAGDQTIKVYVVDPHASKLKITDVVVNSIGENGYDYDATYVIEASRSKTTTEYRMAGLMHKDFSCVTLDNMVDFDERITRAEQYYEKMFMPGIERFLRNIKSKTERVLSERSAIASKCGTQQPPTKKVTIEITYS